MMGVYSDIDMELSKQRDGDVTKDIDDDAIVNSITNIVTTMPGSRRMLPEFAYNFYYLLFEPIDKTTAYLISDKLIECINTWDDRVIITGLKINANYDQNQYECTMDYKIKGSNTIETIDFILKKQ